MSQNKLDDFLREKLADAPSATEQEWSRLSTRVSFMNFFKFGLHHYNIYYTLAVLASLAGLAGALFGLNHNTVYIADANKSGAPKSKTHNNLIVNELQNNSKPNSKAKNFEYPVHENQIAEHKNSNTAIVAVESITIEEVQSNKPEIAANTEDITQISDENQLLALESKTTNSLEVNADASIVQGKEVKTPIRKRWSIEIYSQPIFSDAVELASSNMASGFESVKRKYSFGANVNLEMNHLTLQSGIQFYYFSKDFSNSFTKTEISQVRSYKVFTHVLYGLESGKEVRTISDSVLVVSEKAVTKDYKIQNMNSYKYLEIPLLIGYKQRYQRFSFVAKGGIIFDLYKSAEGIVNQSDNSLELKDVPFLKPNFTASTSLGVYYKLNPFLQCLIEPYFRFNFYGSQSENLSLQTSKFASGLKIGFAYEF